MRFKNLILSTLAVAAIFFIGCSMSSGSSIHSDNSKEAKVKKSVKIGSFNKIEASSGIRVIFTQGKESGVARISTTPSAQKYLKVYVNKGKLIARYEGKGNMNISGQTTVSVIAPDLKDIELSSAARFQANGNLDIRNLEIDLSSAAKATFNNITATEIEIDTSSSSSVSIEKANVNTFEADALSASKITVSKIVATKLELDASSAAKINVGYFNGTTLSTESSSGASVNASGITARNVYSEASSGGSITLKGSCEYLKKSSNSGGRINASQLHSDSRNQHTSGKQTPVRNP